MNPRPLPLTAGALLIGGTIHSHTAIRGDVAPRLHPLVSQLLAQLPISMRERYAGWCAEAVLISDRLWAAEQGLPGPLHPDSARVALSGGVMQVVLVREDGDPAHGMPGGPCRSCQALLDAVGIEFTRPELDQAQAVPGPDGDPRSLARRWALAIAGYAAPDGAQHTVVPAAVDALSVFGGRRVTAPGGGVQVAATGFVIDPTLALHTVHTLAEFGSAVGARMTPVGVEAGGSGFLAVDERGRLFVLDHTAEWWLGDTVESGLQALVSGQAPARVRADGTWDPYGQRNTSWN